MIINLRTKRRRWQVYVDSFRDIPLPPVFFSQIGNTQHWEPQPLRAVPTKVRKMFRGELRRITG